MEKILFLGAAESEVSLLAHSFSENSIIDGIEYHALTCGIGNLNAALFLQELLLKEKFNEIIFIGTAGSYKAVDDELIFSSDFIQIEILCLQGEGKKPEGMNDEILSRPGPLGEKIAKSLNLSRKTVNAPNCITLKKIDAFDFSAFENLEVYGLALVCESHKVFFSAVMPVTNLVSEMGSIQWGKNHKIMSTKLQNSVLEILRNSRI